MLAREDVLDAVGGVVDVVDGADEHVVRDVIEVTAEAQPWSGHRDVIGRALALRLEQQWHVDVLSCNWCLECFECLQTVA